MCQLAGPGDLVGSPQGADTHGLDVKVYCALGRGSDGRITAVG